MEQSNKKPKKYETIPFSDLAFYIHPNARQELLASKALEEGNFSDDPSVVYNLRFFNRSTEDGRSTLVLEERKRKEEALKRCKDIGEVSMVTCALSELPLRHIDILFGPSSEYGDSKEQPKYLERLRRTVAAPYSIKVESDLSQSEFKLIIGAFLSEYVADKHGDRAAIRAVSGQIIVDSIDEQDIPHGRIIPRGEFFEKMAGGVLSSKSPDDSTTPQSERLLPNGAYSRLTGYRQS